MGLPRVLKDNFLNVNKESMQMALLGFQASFSFFGDMTGYDYTQLIKKFPNVSLEHRYKYLLSLAFKGYRKAHDMFPPDATLPLYLITGCKRKKDGYEFTTKMLNVPRKWKIYENAYNEKMRTLVEADPEKYAILYAMNKESENRRTYKGRIRLYILKRDEYCCVFCGSKKELEVDHVTPFKDGGKTTIENGRTLCKQCNTARHHLRHIA